MGNERNVSCIPVGKYRCRYNPHKCKFEVFDVPDRDHIQIHIGNTVADSQGCILVGSTSDIVKGKLYQSKRKFAQLVEYAGADNFMLEVVNSDSSVSYPGVSTEVSGDRRKWRDIAKPAPIPAQPIPAPLKKKSDGIKRGISVVAFIGAQVVKIFHPVAGQIVEIVAGGFGLYALGDAAIKSKPEHDGTEGKLYKILSTIVRFLAQLIKQVGKK